MKKLIPLILLLTLLLGCGTPKADGEPTTKGLPKLVYTTSFNENIYDSDVEKAWRKAVIDKEGISPVLTSLELEPYEAKIDSYDKNLLNIQAFYKVDGKECGTRMLIHYESRGRYEVIRYTNYQTGK